MHSAGTHGTHAEERLKRRTELLEDIDPHILHNRAQDGSASHWEVHRKRTNKRTVPADLLAIASTLCGIVVLRLSRNASMLNSRLQVAKE